MFPPIKSRMISALAGLAAILALSVALASCGKSEANMSRAVEDDARRSRIAVSNTWLECCLRDLGYDKPLTRICPPGACPGHFDIRPGDIAEIRNCRLVALFDFQQSMSDKLKTVASDGLEIIAIKAPGGLCVPANYLSGCRAVHEELKKAFPENAPVFDEAMDSLVDRIAELENELRQRIEQAGLKDTRVIASGHQAEFCRWLGLKPIAVYSGPETARPARIDALLAKGKSLGVEFIIANLQEGSQAAEAFSERLGASVVVFSNFPSMAPDQTSFHDLARANVTQLIEAAGKPN